jgi:hypothetical protein
MSDDLTFSAIGFRAHVAHGFYDVDRRVGDEWAAWFLPRYPKSPEMIKDPSGEHWPTREAAIDACRTHNAQRMGAVSMAPAGPVSVDANGAPTV